MLSQSSSGNNPLLYSEEYDRARRSLRRQSVRDVARFLRRASSRRMMREPSMLVRETAAEQLEERQSDWAHSKPVVILDLIWNLGFVVAVVVVLVLSRDETPTTWLRLWIVGYAVQCVVHMEGASKEDIELLPKFTFHREGGAGRTNDEIQGVCGGVMTEYGTETPIERVLSPKDAECCICLSAYDDGVELRELPCCHHFHCSCIDKWLYINATCPLCKYNIVRNGSHGCDEA
ncbi:Zinc finger, RING/FYVE/PHD-type [Cynara cardunculus var. scolymus]|uniref:RING-type E3 ubiquitin transferase n=1 Tax=Cynara cardunculus var. scolymus TaxID=59895 RepID=A0A103XRA4_CYNCS|nr:Zinc finger, RING/FYVE/PHD-type [Cynara cardunculus var. scolymus]